MDALRTTQEGMPFVDFTVPNGNPDGTPVKFSGYIGKGKCAGTLQYQITGNTVFIRRASQPAARRD